VKKSQKVRQNKRDVGGKYQKIRERINTLKKVMTTEMVRDYLSKGFPQIITSAHIRFCAPFGIQILSCSGKIAPT